MPPPPPQGAPHHFESHSKFEFRSNVNGQEFSLNLDEPDFNELDEFMDQMMDQDIVPQPQPKMEQKPE